MCSRSIEANFGEKMSAKSKYSVRMKVKTLFTTNIAICAL